MDDTAPGVAGGRVDRMLVGRYRLTRFIACGGMAEVWEGRDLRLARPVAIKMPLPHLRHLDHAMERFRREAVAAARLSHPNVVAVYDTGTDGPDTFIVMERVVGESLADVLSHGVPMPVERAVAIAAQVAGALEFAHRAGVVHRDVKPANILVTSDGQVKVADFGIAKAIQEEGLTGLTGLTDVGAMVGTARYASPEQLEGRPPDGRTDVYALGVVLYEMLCGQAPFRADSEIAVAVAHMQEAPVPPSQLRAGLPRWLEEVVLRSLAKDPADRFASAAEMRAVLLDDRGGMLLDDRGGIDPAGPTPADGPGAAALVGTPATAARVGPPAAPPGLPTAPPGPPALPTRAPAAPPLWAPAAPTRAPGRARTGVPGGRGRPRQPAGRGGLTGRRRLPLMVAGVVLAALAVVGILVSQLSGGPAPTTPNASGPPSGTGRGLIPGAVPVAGAVMFDPYSQGAIGILDPKENAALIPNLYAGNPSTYWTTEIYTNESFGGLKPGLGFVLELAHVDSLNQLTLRTSGSTLGWHASVYVSNQVACKIGGWGTPVAHATATATTTSFNLKGRHASEVLVWITRLGPALKASIGDASLTGSVGATSAALTPGASVCGAPATGAQTTGFETTGP